MVLFIGCGLGVSSLVIGLCKANFKSYEVESIGLGSDSKASECEIISIMY